MDKKLIARYMLLSQVKRTRTPHRRARDNFYRGFPRLKPQSCLERSPRAPAGRKLRAFSSASLRASNSAAAKLVFCELPKSHSAAVRKTENFAHSREAAKVPSTDIPDLLRNYLFFGAAGRRHRAAAAVMDGNELVNVTTLLVTS